MKQRIWTLPEKAKFLRQVTVEVRRIAPPIKAVIVDLFDTWPTVAAYGIAAPQIGASYRMFIWKGEKLVEPEIIINPQIVKSEGEVLDYDGCLSVPGIYGETRRAKRVVLRATDSSGNRFERTIEGFDARIIQHEVDHLNGTLFIDRVNNMDDLYTLQKTEDDGEEEFLEVPLTVQEREFIDQSRKTLG